MIMENIVLFDISLDPETHLWDIVSVDPDYAMYDQHRVMGGSQFMFMQDITDVLAKEYDKVAAFKIVDDAPHTVIVQVEHADTPVYAD